MERLSNCKRQLEYCFVWLVKVLGHFIYISLFFPFVCIHTLVSVNIIVVFLHHSLFCPSNKNVFCTSLCRHSFKAVKTSNRHVLIDLVSALAWGWGSLLQYCEIKLSPHPVLLLSMYFVFLDVYLMSS